MLESSSTLSFRLAGGHGAALVTKYPTYREDVQLAGAFEKYTKEHYASWVTFARETGHGDIDPVLVTGVDRTKDFAMLGYSNDDDDLRCKLSALVPGSYAWGSGNRTGFVYTNHGPQVASPLPPQTADLASSGDDDTETASDGYSQYVFIRYYTMRKKLGVPRLKAAAGPHNLPGWGRDGEGSSVEANHDPDSGSDSDSDTALFDDDSDDDGGYTILDRDPPAAFWIIPQTQYRCTTRQRGWVPQPPIEFGGVRLTDAASPRYPDIPSQDDEVFSCEDLGSSISCLLNVS